MSAVASAVPTPATKATPGIALATRVAGQDTVLPAPLLALLVSLCLLYPSPSPRDS